MRQTYPKDRFTWKKSKVAFLLANHKSLSCIEIGKTLGKSASDVRAKCIRLGLSFITSLRRYSAYEDNLILLYYQQEGANAVALRLDRSIKAVIARAVIISATPPSKKWTAREQQILASAYARGGINLAAKKLPFRTRQAIKTRARLHGIKAPRGQKWTPEDIDYLTSNLSLLTLAEVSLQLKRKKSAVHAKACELRLLTKERYLVRRRSLRRDFNRTIMRTGIRVLERRLSTAI